ncbi:hypothetical protein BCU79_01155 [Vibrio breoganii]|nr:hypothetical protein BCU79_01155 [Vibrio breoganii]PMM87952.1 hypothetical protein BCT44_03720 [Vibrio breoganii]
MAIYNRSQYLPEKREALNMWTEQLGLLMTPESNIESIGTANDFMLVIWLFFDLQVTPTFS